MVTPDGSRNVKAATYFALSVAMNKLGRIMNQQPIIVVIQGCGAQVDKQSSDQGRRQGSRAAQTSFVDCLQGSACVAATIQSLEPFHC